MSKTLTFLFVFFFFFVKSTLQAQSLCRVAISSGGISSDTINATIGEIFVFTINGGGMSLSTGSQSNTDSTGCIITTVAKTENTQSEILVYPNPVEGFLNLQINGLQSENISFQVYDVTGKNVLTQNSTGNNNLYRLYVHELAAGDYFVKGFTSKGQGFGQIKFLKF